MKKVTDASLIAEYSKSPYIKDMIPKSILSNIVFWSADAGDEIIKDGTVPDTLYLLISGRAVLRMLLPNGRYIIPGTMKSPDFIGEMELLGFDADPINVRALDKCILAGITFSSSRNILLEDTVFLRRLCLEISRKERDKIFHIARTHGYPLPNRLAEFIMETSENGIFKIRKIDTSESLGTTYRRLGQVLSDFESRGILDKTGRYYRISDPEYLECLAEELKF